MGGSGMDVYRVRYRRGDVEIEVESADKEYVETKLTELLAVSAPPEDTGPAGTRRQSREKKPAVERSADRGDEGHGLMSRHWWPLCRNRTNSRQSSAKFSTKAHSFPGS